MRLSSSLVASSAFAILSTALLSVPAVSQITTGPALPSVTVDAPKRVAKPPAPQQGANIRTSRRVSSTGSSTARTPSFPPNSILGQIARLEKQARSCNGGCETSYRVGNAPWVGCSYGGENLGVSSIFSTTCTDTLTYKAYRDCLDTKTLLGSTGKEARWICSSLHAGNKFTEKKVVQYKPSSR